MVTYGHKHPTEGEGLQLHDALSCYVIKVDDLYVCKITYQTITVLYKGIFNTTIYLGKLLNDPLIIKDSRLAEHLAESTSKAFPGRNVKVVKVLDDKEGNSK